jgi:hypothetical protein
MAPFKIGTWNFSSKKILQERLQQCLHNNPIGFVVLGEDGEILKCLVQRHRYAEELIGPGLLGVVIGTDSYGGSNFQALRIDGTCQAFSYIKALSNQNPLTDKRNRINRAFRNEIHSQIVEFKTKATCKEQSCSGMLMFWETLDVDHVDKSFAQIRNDFLEYEGLSLDEVMYKEDEDSDSTSLVDRSLAKRWFDWHKKEAVLVALHRDEHRKKDGAQITPLTETYLKGSPKADKLLLKKDLLNESAEDIVNSIFG